MIVKIIELYYKNELWLHISMTIYIKDQILTYTIEYNELVLRKFFRWNIIFI